jgi:hypothetical protein
MMKVFFHQSMFQETHEKWLKDISMTDESIIFCHFDADLYSSTLFGVTKIGSLKKPY